MNLYARSVRWWHNALTRCLAVDGFSAKCAWKSTRSSVNPVSLLVPTADDKAAAFMTNVEAKTSNVSKLNVPMRRVVVLGKESFFT